MATISKGPHCRVPGVDQGLLQSISAMRAIEDYAHPLPLGFEPAGDIDRPIQPYDCYLSTRTRPYNPEYLDAWADIWGYELQIGSYHTFRN